MDGNIVDKLRLLAKDRRASNILSHLRKFNHVVKGSDLLPGAVNMDALEAIAVALYRQERSDLPTDLQLAQVKLHNPRFLSQEHLMFTPTNTLGETGKIFSKLLELKLPHSQVGSNRPNFVFVETLTASERLRNQLILDQSILLDGKLYKRTPCAKGRPGDGYSGCALYQIDALVNGSLGIHLSKREVDLFYTTGAMPQNATSRVCILCYSQLLTFRAAMFGVKGVGSKDYMDTSMYYQDLVNCSEGFQQKFMILPGSGSSFPIAPFLSFHPRQLRLSMRGGELYVDESSMWYRPEPMGFRPGAAC